ncbi:MAG TPA: RpiB/LacA/LacB family sugar-phosphate isomerase [Candidatus Saccharimonadales bacterium]|nr:RpiB/LacA/LacB family sugar-phosphate isomerase [Candidatus Saccharimonadales bacterium]
MKIYLASDHAGFHLKSRIHAYLVQHDYDVEDVGDETFDPKDDYPQFAYAATTKLLGTKEDARAILICGSGQGMCIAANRVHGIRATVVESVWMAKDVREDDDSNILCLPARVLEKQDSKLVTDILDTWLKTPFSNAPRHTRRLKEIEELYG